MTTPELLTDVERDLVHRLGAWWNEFQTIVGPAETRAQDLNEAIAHVHALQRTVLKQTAARAYPEEFRLLGGLTPSQEASRPAGRMFPDEGGALLLSEGRLA